MAQTVVDLVLKTSGLAQLTKVDKALKGIGAEAVKAGAGVDRMAKAVGRVSGAGLNNLAAGFDRLKASADRAAASAKKAVVAASKSNAAKGIAAAGAFSGLPGAGLVQAIGAGGLAGGPVGAAAAGITAVGIAAVQTGNQVAQFSAEVSKLEIALRNVAGPNTTQALNAIRDVVDDFNVPIKDATAGFTRLAAATSAAGFSIGDTEQVYRSLSAANKALGGDTEKLSGILLATTQVFSKGKVTAEELRGQIGERLPGAVSEFAKATGRTTAELDKALEQGEVGLEDFVTFTKSLLDKYEKNAQVIADSPAEAGARLKTALQDLQRAIGPLLEPIGAAFQNLFTGIIKLATAFVNRLNEIFGLGAKGAVKKAQNEFDAQFKTVQRLEKLVEEGKGGRRLEARFKKAQAQLSNTRTELQALQAEARKAAGFGIEVDQTSPKPDLPDLDTGTTKGSSKAAPTGADGDAIAQSLERQIALLQTKDTLERELLQNQFTFQDNIENAEDILDKGLRQQAKALSAELLRTQNMEAYTKYANEGFKEAMAIVQAERDALLPLEQQRGLLEAKLNGTEKEYRIQQEVERIMKAAPTLERARVEEMVRGNQAMEDRLTQVQKMEQLMSSAFQRVGTAIEDSIVAGIDAAINGAEDLNKKLQSIASSLLGDIGRMLIRAGIGGIGTVGSAGSGSGLLGQIFNREDGGPVVASRPYIVGEREPELFVPRTSGTIYNQEQMQSAMSTYSEANTGGTVATAPIDVSYNVTEINAMRFVTEEQMVESSRQSAMQGAKLGEQRALNRLRQSRSTRNKLGM